MTYTDAFNEKPYVKIVKPPVEVLRRRWNVDERGKLVEILRVDDSVFKSDFGQVYCTTIQPNMIKAWHRHKRQTDRIMVLGGVVRFVGVLEKEDATEEEKSTETVLDFIVHSMDPYLIVIPPGIWHGFQNMGSIEAYIINVPDQQYHHDHPDEERAVYSDPRFCLSWCLDLNR